MQSFYVAKIGVNNTHNTFHETLNTYESTINKFINNEKETAFVSAFLNHGSPPIDVPLSEEGEHNQIAIIGSPDITSYTKNVDYDSHHYKWIIKQAGDYVISASVWLDSNDSAHSIIAPVGFLHTGKVQKTLAVAGVNQYIHSYLSQNLTSIAKFEEGDTFQLFIVRSKHAACRINNFTCTIHLV